LIVLISSALILSRANPDPERYVLLGLFILGLPYPIPFVLRSLFRTYELVLGEFGVDFLKSLILLSSLEPLCGEEKEFSCF
jgi:hypothetical protein